MSAVDVRAAHAEAYALLLGFGEREAAGRINSVNEAVAELIEALRLCRDELIGIDGHITNPDNPDGWTDGDLYAAYAKASTALANIGAAQ